MNLPCEIVQDLLPLYHDGVCSEGSTVYVKEHLADCPACSRMLQEIEEEIVVPRLETEHAKPLLSIQVSWNKHKRKTLRRCIAAGIMVFLLFVGCWWALTQWCIVPLKGSDFTILNQCILSDGCIFVEYTWEYGNCALNVWGMDSDRGVEYQTRFRPILGRKDAEVGHPYAPKNGLYFFPEEQKMLDSSGTVIPIQEIYLGTEKDGLLLWARDMELPPASQRVEEDYRMLLDAYDAPNAPVQPAVISVIHGTIPEAADESVTGIHETIACPSEE